MRVHRATSLVSIMLATVILVACGSSSSGDSASSEETSIDESSEVAEGDTNSESEAPSSGGNGVGTVTIDGKTFAFDLQCAFDEETMNEQVSISMKGTGNDGIELAFTQMWGIDLSTMKMSPDAPPAHSISMYEMPGVTQVYSYDSISDKVLDVSGKTVSGTVMFFRYENGETVGMQPSLSGDVNLRCD